MAYIDEKKVKRKLQYIFKVYGVSEVIKSKINKALAECTADVAEVKHGEWLPDYETFVDSLGYETEPVQTGWVCSLCGRQGFSEEPYCHCGAKMDENALKERETE